MSAMAKISEDQVLIERFGRGDDSAFDGIVQRHAAEVAALANRLLGWPQDVDDIVQEVFVAAFKGLKRFRGDCRLRTWLFTITVNKCRRHRRRPVLDPVDAAARDDCPEHNAERKMLDVETFERVRRAVRALPPKYREVVALRYLQELETVEVCQLLGITVNAMQVRLNRARNRLKEDLSEWIEDNL